MAELLPQWFAQACQRHDSEQYGPIKVMYFHNRLDLQKAGEDIIRTRDAPFYEFPRYLANTRAISDHGPCATHPNRTHSELAPDFSSYNYWEHWPFPQPANPPNRTRSELAPDISSYNYWEHWPFPQPADRRKIKQIGSKIYPYPIGANPFHALDSIFGEEKSSEDQNEDDKPKKSGEKKEGEKKKGARKIEEIKHQIGEEKKEEKEEEKEEEQQTGRLEGKKNRKQRRKAIKLGRFSAEAKQKLLGMTSLGVQAILLAILVVRKIYMIHLETSINMLL